MLQQHLGRAVQSTVEHRRGCTAAAGIEVAWRFHHAEPPTSIYYVDLAVRAGLTLEQAISEACQLDEWRRAAGSDQAALDEAARKGLANGAVEDWPRMFLPWRVLSRSRSAASHGYPRGRVRGRLARETQGQGGGNGIRVREGSFGSPLASDHCFFLKKEAPCNP